MDKITTCELVFNRENSKHFHLYLWINLPGYFLFSPIFKRISEITVRQFFNLLRKFFANDFVDFFDMVLKRKYLLRFSCLYLTNQKLFSYEIVVMLVHTSYGCLDQIKTICFGPILIRGTAVGIRGAGGNCPRPELPLQILTKTEATQPVGT